MTKENNIEQNFINKLIEQKYTYRPDIRTRDALNQNFREKFQELNFVNLSDAEFSRVLDQIITSDVFTASKRLREYNTFERDDGTPLHYTLVNIKDWCKNSFEVINQLRINTDNSYHRYDVILLINGIPLVQVELKTLDISTRRAMQQIIEYKNDAGNGYTKTLLCFMQLFVVSNQHNTYYFANNNTKHFNFNADERFLPLYEYADEKNKKIHLLNDFTNTFLSKCILGEMISRYMVLVASEQKLMMMRPYQIYAVKAIVKSIERNSGNGYIWHTTGSGKTLTSFKASTLLKDNPDIEKCLFVVDRKDLDRQTREEFNRFQDGCVEENTNTDTLVKRLLSDNYNDKVIVTTIQKLGIALDSKNGYKKSLELLSDKRVVFIFDECHRSQFGENHKAIKEFFPRSQLFGFTGTPIFIENSTYTEISGEEKTIKTTKDLFENELHTYTITNAIEDDNVLRFHVDYYQADNQTQTNTISQKAVVEAIIAKHDAATQERKFNAILATSSINHAIEYHRLFKSMEHSLNIACVFSPPVQVLDSNATNKKDIEQLEEDLPQEKADNSVKPNEKKKALIEIINDYNAQYGTNHDINNFDTYYQDVQQRIKDQQYSNADYPHKNKIDITIVVDMLLTGFDSKYLNTIYVDKNLKYHGLIQAFSRTNRILNDTKPYGNILDFRAQEDEVDKAMVRFSGKNLKEEAKKIWLVESAPVVIEKLDNAVSAMESFMISKGLKNTPEQVHNLQGDEDKARFINLFKAVQRLKTSLDQYTDLSEENKQIIEEVIPKDTLRAFKGAYLETAAKLKALQGKNRDDVSSVVEELDFEFVLFASAVIDYDYIMSLIAKYTGTSSEKQKMNKSQLIGLIESDAKFMGEVEDIKAYIETLKMGEVLNEEEIKIGYELFKAKKSSNKIDEIAANYGLDKKALGAFVNLTLTRFIFDAQILSDLFAPLELGWKERAKKEAQMMSKLIPLLKKQAGEYEISGLSAYEE
ncbi:MAG: DEAD/DEAH box helicase [Sulfurimonas sp. RIFOXYD12_FULL_33_39]|uniref:type I restriction endonuclease subunit R n=1 Tax=unclassified Sulfurimonas TaxID=2623549 RepID=UPI0008D89650|nr:MULTISPECIES: type I restriction endonuclease subunit R [unclassified Sulfurimonas]OHE11001.1 MAG: DEAD/DEAH box helicase [Sulfurimonas sp. RIFOXYD12_FULL_33_39]OHE13523.1 MAG: DEAD/DEAH box helicase [Sulfurimonas sp. RIFOXYD2_FULL_34_21]